MFLEKLSQDPQLNVPTPNDADILIYKPKKTVWKPFEKQYLENTNTLTAEELVLQQDKLLCAFSFWDFGAIIDMKPKTGGLYLHSASEPYNEEGQLSYKRVDLWLEHFGLNRVQSHCSGHSKGKDLLEIVQSIDSDMLFPIHTESPDSYKKVTEKLTIVQEAKKYEL